jgi:hypothetical protein
VVERVRLSDSPSLFRQGGPHRLGVPVRPHHEAAVAHERDRRGLLSLPKTFEDLV